MYVLGNHDTLVRVVESEKQTETRAAATNDCVPNSTTKDNGDLPNDQDAKVTVFELHSAKPVPFQSDAMNATGCRLTKSKNDEVLLPLHRSFDRPS